MTNSMMDVARRSFRIAVAHSVFQTFKQGRRIPSLWTAAAEPIEVTFRCRQVAMTPRQSAEPAYSAPLER